jgi:glucose-1-phosphate adenylyltransferase
VIGSEIDHSIVGIRSQIGPSARLARTIVMGAVLFESDAEKAANTARGLPNVGVGANCVIERAIIDKNASIGANTVVRALPNRPDLETQNYIVRDGIVVVIKNATIAAGTVIERLSRRAVTPATKWLPAGQSAGNPIVPTRDSARSLVPTEKSPPGSPD